MQYETDANDELNKNEIKKFFGDNVSSYKLNPVEFEKFFKEIDVDKNGSISKNEMVNLVSKIMKEKEQKSD